MKCCEVRTKSLKQYRKADRMKNSVKKMHFDVGASWVN